MSDFDKLLSLELDRSKHEASRQLNDYTLRLEEAKANIAMFVQSLRSRGVSPVTLSGSGLKGWRLIGAELDMGQVVRSGLSVDVDGAVYIDNHGSVTPISLESPPDQVRYLVMADLLSVKRLLLVARMYIEGYNSPELCGM